MPAASVISTAPPPSDPGRICAVCGIKASGLHFGVFTCESCKLFYLRVTKTNAEDQLSCSGPSSPGNNSGPGLCVINERTRAYCRYCRFNKCRSVGMARQNSRLGRNARVPKPKSAAEISIIPPSKYEVRLSVSTISPTPALDTLSTTRVTTASDNDHDHSTVFNLNATQVTSCDSLLISANQNQGIWTETSAAAANSAAAALGIKPSDNISPSLPPPPPATPTPISPSQSHASFLTNGIAGNVSMSPSNQLSCFSSLRVAPATAYVDETSVKRKISDPGGYGHRVANTLPGCAPRRKFSDISGVGPFSALPPVSMNITTAVACSNDFKQQSYEKTFPSTITGNYIGVNLGSTRESQFSVSSNSIANQQNRNVPVDIGSRMQNAATECQHSFFAVVPPQNSLQSSLPVSFNVPLSVAQQMLHEQENFKQHQLQLAPRSPVSLYRPWQGGVDISCASTTNNTTSLRVEAYISPPNNNKNSPSLYCSNQTSTTSLLSRARPAVLAVAPDHLSNAAYDSEKFRFESPESPVLARPPSPVIGFHASVESLEGSYEDLEQFHEPRIAKLPKITHNEIVHGGPVCSFPEPHIPPPALSTSTCEQTNNPPTATTDTRSCALGAATTLIKQEHNSSSVPLSKSCSERSLTENPVACEITDAELQPFIATRSVLDFEEVLRILDPPEVERFTRWVELYDQYIAEVEPPCIITYRTCSFYEAVDKNVNVLTTWLDSKFFRENISLRYFNFRDRISKPEESVKYRNLILFAACIPCAITSYHIYLQTIKDSNCPLGLKREINRFNRQS